MFGNNFPISDYYKDNILDAETISRSGGWWTAVLVIDDPKTKKPFVGFYRWRFSEDGWKTQSRFFLRKKADVISVRRKLEEYSDFFET